MFVLGVLFGGVLVWVALSSVCVSVASEHSLWYWRYISCKHWLYRYGLYIV